MLCPYAVHKTDSMNPLTAVFSVVTGFLTATLLRSQILPITVSWHEKENVFITFLTGKKSSGLRIMGSAPPLGSTINQSGKSLCYSRPPQPY